jgi:ubiquinone/menaquinone biosynthesis C-methylase UbiE
MTRTGENDEVTETYSNVDSSADVRAALDWQDRIDAWPQIRAYKEWSYECAGASRPLLDVGCGTGSDLVELGAGAVGIDRSAAMVARADERGCSVLAGEAGRLPFPKQSFGAVRTDRVLQHIPDPLQALEEMIRVTRPAGRVVVADPDQESLVIHVPGVRRELVAQVKQLRRDVGYRNGTLARSLPEAFAAAGLIDVRVRAFPLVLTDPDDAFGLPGWVTYWRDRGHPFAASDERDWNAGIERGRAGGFVYALLYLVVSGTVR